MTAPNKAIDLGRVGLSIDQIVAACDKLWSRSEEQGDCYFWTGARNDRGYGQVVFESKVWYAHRLSWEAYFGPIPEGLYVCHHCDNPSCWRPGHLFLGTNSDNQRDAQRKGRRAEGERHHAGRLTEASVRAIRTRYADGGITQRELAAEHGVNQGLVSRIVRGKSWGSVA